MAEYADFLDGISIHLPKCPRPIILNAIKHSAKKFCNESRIWVMDVPDIDVTPDNRIYPLDVPSEASICYVHSLHGRDGVGDAFGRGKRMAALRYHIDHPNMLVIDEQYVQGQTLKPVVSLKPMQNALTCADILFDEYYDAIVAGAVAYLQMQPVTNWSVPNMSQIHLAVFDEAIDTARQSLNRGFGISEPNYRTRPSYR